MIRIIKTLEARSIDLADGIWIPLPLVPGTGTIERSDKQEDAGRLATMKLSATLSSAPDIARDALELKVTFCDGREEIYGSEDLPLRLSVTETDVVKIECSYDCPVF